MDAIEEIDPLSATMTVQAGAPLETVQQAAARAGLLPLDLGARGSCIAGRQSRDQRRRQPRDPLWHGARPGIGVGSGAGRRQRAGWHAQDGEGQHRLRPSPPYDRQRRHAGRHHAVRLRPRPQAVATAYCGLSGYDAVTRLLAELRAPLSSRHAFYVLESEGADSAGHQAAFEQFMGAMLDAGVIENAAIAQSTSDATAFWRVRDATAEFPMLLPDLVAFDVSFAIADIGSPRSAATRRCARPPPAQCWPRPPGRRQPAPDRAGARRTGHRPGRAGRCRRGHGLRHRARASRLSVGRTRHRRQEARRPRPYPQPGRVGRHAGHQGRAGSSRHPSTPASCCPRRRRSPNTRASTC